MPLFPHEIDATTTEPRIIPDKFTSQVFQTHVTFVPSTCFCFLCVRNTELASQHASLRSFPLFAVEVLVSTKWSVSLWKANKENCRARNAFAPSRWKANRTERALKLIARSHASFWQASVSG
ncbi:hypothetical protein NPIL_156711 [Nephila pilipes]|uniref:Uncharacterized protein n=1 Tax=Nephila pilipes TaxID=299642 RepID=A0A8X6TKL3_NEPPI|nr:hypothetical protein NPIL_156711 [Nephila pilipes]